MPIFKNRKQENFTVLDNDMIQNKNLSWKARGILTYLLSLPEDWKVNTKELATHATEGISSLRSGIKELREKGYIVYKKYKDEEGKFVHEYNIHEFPQKPDSDNPDTENPDVDYPNMENRDINKELNEQRTKEQKTNKQKRPSDKSDNASDKFALQQKTTGGNYIYPDEYENIYEAYPFSRGNKKAGWRKWAATRRRGISQEKLMKATKNYAKVCEADDTPANYVKHLRTFFGPDEHWREYLEIDAKSQKSRKEYKEAAEL